MKLVGCVVIFAFLIATSESSFEPDQRPILHGEDLKVPGDNPLEYCDSSADDILSINHADLIPNEIKP